MGLEIKLSQKYFKTVIRDDKFLCCKKKILDYLKDHFYAMGMVDIQSISFLYKKSDFAILKTKTNGQICKISLEEENTEFNSIRVFGYFPKKERFIVLVYDPFHQIFYKKSINNLNTTALKYIYHFCGIHPLISKDNPELSQIIIEKIIKQKYK